MILFAYRLPGDLELGRDELLQRGFPAAFLTDRSGPQALRVAFSQDNATNWKLTGKARQFRLFDELGRMAAEVGFVSGSDMPSVAWQEGWVPANPGLDPDSLATVRQQVVEKWNRFIHERVQYYLNHIDRQNIQRSLDRWLSTETNSRPEIIPSLHTCPDLFEPVLAKAYTVLPEADWKFWRIGDTK